MYGQRGIARVPARVAIHSRHEKNMGRRSLTLPRFSQGFVVLLCSRHRILALYSAVGDFSFQVSWDSNVELARSRPRLGGLSVRAYNFPVFWPMCANVIVHHFIIPRFTNGNRQQQQKHTEAHTRAHTNLFNYNLY